MSFLSARRVRAGFDRIWTSPGVVAVRDQIARRKRLLAALAFIGLLALFVWKEGAQFPTLWRTISGANLWWLAAAIALEFGLIGMTALGYTVILRRLGYDCRWRTLLGIYLRATVASSLVPIGEPAAAVVVIRGLGEQGIPPDDGFLAWSLADVIGFTGIFALLLPTVVMLAVERRLPTAVLLGAAVLTVVLGIVTGVMALVLRAGRLASPLERLVPAQVEAFLLRARRHGLGLRALLPAIGLSVLGEIGSVVVLEFVLRAVGDRGTDPVAPLIAYEVGIAAKMISPIYQGTGAVELSTVTALEQLGVAAAPALAVTLLYRTFGLWLPVVGGLASHAIRRLRRASERREPAGAPPA